MSKKLLKSSKTQAGVPKTWGNFFLVSNAIEGVYDYEETSSIVDIFSTFILKGTKKSISEIMFEAYNFIGYKNEYCKEGLRDYDVYVKGKKCMNPKLIKKNLDKLFEKELKTFSEIKRWHVRFENIHPFGDGNGRTGRLLMLYQAEKAGVELPDMFYELQSIDLNRGIYYSWFKTQKERDNIYYY